MAETNPTKQEDIVFINETYGTPKNLNKIHAHTAAVTYAGDNISQVDLTKNAVLRKRVALTYSGDNIATANVKLYGLDGATVDYEKTVTLSYDGDNIDGFASVEV